MAFIPLRVLKSKPCSGADAPAGNAVDIDMRLLAPALEPFLLLRARYRNYHGAPYSIQFALEGGDLFHYLNLEHIADLPEGEPVEIVAVGELPLTVDTAWRILQFEQGGPGKEIGRLHYEPYRVWRLRMIPDRIGLKSNAHNPRQLMLIGGAPKSGTTWVERILNSHPHALATGENQFFGWPLPRVGHHQLMVSRPPPYFSIAVPQKPPFWSQVVMHYAGRAERILGQIGAVADVQVVADKSPENGKFLHWALEALPDWKYIHCVRHPLDVAVSRFFHERALLAATPELSMLPSDKAVRNRLLAYNTENAKPGEMFADLPLFDFILDGSLEGTEVFQMLEHYKGIHIIHYEDILADFAGETRRLFAFCELEVDDALLDDISRRNKFEAFSGGRKAGEESEREFFRKGVAGDHVNHMSADQIEYAKRRILAQCDWYKRYF